MNLRLSPATLTQRLSDAIIVRTRASELLLQASCRFNKARCLLVRTDRSLALQRYARLQSIVQFCHLRVGLGQGCGMSVAGPNEILLGQPELARREAGWHPTSALFVECSISLGLFVLGGHGRQKCG